MSETQAAEAPQPSANTLDPAAIRSFPEPAERQEPEQPETPERPEGDQPEGAEPKPEGAKPDEGKKPAAWVDRRVAQLTARLAAIEAERDALAAQLPKGDPSGQPKQESPQEQAQRLRSDAVKQVREEERTAAFTAECNKIADLGGKEIPGFLDSMKSMWDGLGGFNPALAEAAIEVGDAHQVLYKLAQDPDEAERISKLSPSRMGVALAKMAATQPAAPPPPPQSRAPAPIKPLAKGGGNPEPRLDANSQEEFEAAFRRERDKKRGK